MTSIKQISTTQSQEDAKILYDIMDIIYRNPQWGINRKDILEYIKIVNKDISNDSIIEKRLNSLLKLDLVTNLIVDDVNKENRWFLTDKGEFEYLKLAYLEVKRLEDRSVR